MYALRTLFVSTREDLTLVASEADGDVADGLSGGNVAPLSSGSPAQLDSIADTAATPASIVELRYQSAFTDWRPVRYEPAQRLLGSSPNG